MQLECQRTSRPGLVRYNPGVQTDSQAAILPYDKSLNREGIAIDHHGGFFRVITPRVASWRTLSKWWFFGFALTGFYALVPALGALARGKPMQFEEVIITFEFTCVLAILLITAFVQVNHRYI